MNPKYSETLGKIHDCVQGVSTWAQQHFIKTVVTFVTQPPVESGWNE